MLTHRLFDMNLNVTISNFGFVTDCHSTNVDLFVCAYADEKCFMLLNFGPRNLIHCDRIQW